MICLEWALSLPKSEYFELKKTDFMQTDHSLRLFHSRVDFVNCAYIKGKLTLILPNCKQLFISDYSEGL